MLHASRDYKVLLYYSRHHLYPRIDSLVPPVNLADAPFTVLGRLLNLNLSVGDADSVNTELVANIQAISTKVALTKAQIIPDSQNEQGSGGGVARYNVLSQEKLMQMMEEASNPPWLKELKEYASQHYGKPNGQPCKYVKIEDPLHDLR